MKEITIKFTEQNLINLTGKTVDELADLNEYQSKIVNPDYVPAQGAETIDDTSADPIDTVGGEPVYPQIPNPDYVPAVGEPIIDNPKTRTQHLAEKLTQYAVEKGAEKIKSVVLNDAVKQAEASFKQSVDALIESAEITVVE